jgi:hypothetical protein
LHADSLDITHQSTARKPPVSSQNIQKDVGELRQALGCGDLSSAFEAYTKLQTDLRNAEQPNADQTAVDHRDPSGSSLSKTAIYA